MNSQVEYLKSLSPGRQNGGKSCQMWQESVDKVKYGSAHCSAVTHGLRHVLHVTCEDPVRHMSCGAGAAGFASLHSSGRVQFYYPDGRQRDPLFCQSVTIQYAGLTSTHLPGRMVGWGPGAILSVLDAELNPLIHAEEPMDVRVCEILESSNEFVTAGMGNVCVWCLTHLVCRKQIVDGLGRHVVFTHLALLPSGARQGFRALAAYGRAVVVVDLLDGCIVEHKKNLHLREITGMVYCPLRDIVVTASDMTIRVWGLDWELQMAFVGHTALVTSLVLCPVSGLLLSSSLDGTMRCWSPEVGDQVLTVSVPNECSPSLVMGGPDSAGTFFSYSTNSVDFWTLSCLYNLHCRLDGVLGGPVRQISTPPSPPSFQVCVVCIHGDSDVTVVAADTDAVLTRFQTNGKVRSADYCVPKDILLILTEDGAVTIASTLTSPVTILDEWYGIEHWEWAGGEVEAKIGMVCYMVLYSDFTDTQNGQEDRRSLKMQRTHKPKKIKLLHDANRFLVILGHCGGWVSVLNMHSGKVQFRTSAHNNQNIISMQAYPNSGYLLTAGEDKALLVWSVFPHAHQCLSLHFSVSCDQPPVFLALMGTRLALALEDAENDTYSLVQYSLESQTQSDQQPSEEHQNKITGLCACHQLNVFASSSQDGTVRIWDMENHLLRILELNAEPECLAYCEKSGDLLLGIMGDLYRIPHANLLPLDCRTQKCDPDSDLPKSRILNTSHKYKSRTESCHVAKKDGPERPDSINNSEFGALMARHKDLESLQKGDVECRRKKSVPIQRKQEAFSNYLSLIYRQPPDIRIPEEDMFDVYAILFPPKLPELPPLSPASFTDGLSKRLHSPKTQSELDEVQLLHNKEEEEKEAHMHLPSIIEKSSSQKSPLPPPPLEEELIYPPPKPLPPIKHPTPPLTPPSEPASPSPPIAPPTLVPHSPSPSPLSQSKQPTPLPPLPPSSYLPEFFTQFMDEQWFQKMFTDLSCIPSSLGPKDFCIRLLDFMMSCSMAQKNSIINALLMLIQQEVLNKEFLNIRLLVCLQNCIHKNMSREEQHFVGELLNLMVYLSPDSPDTIVELLAMLADKKVDLKALVLRVLQRLGVQEAELWLCPEFESWDTLTKHQPNQHHSLREMASHWLLTWTRKHKVHSGSVFLHSEGVQSVSTPVEVLKYFCSVQKSKQIRPPPPPLEGRKDVVMVPSGLPRLKPIQRLGETHSMSRIRIPQGHLLPPLPYRPLLMGFTRFLSLPVAHVTLSPFPFSLDFRIFRRPSPQKYFVLERSYVQYYR